MNKEYVEFTKEMAKDYTVLCPNMLPMHFKLIFSVLETYGLNVELLTHSGPEIAETGLKYTHNDACYPAVLVIGQFLTAIQSGKYDPHKTALIMFQTGGGCRASNYIFLIRKALKKAGYGYIPVISFNFNGLESHSGFKLNLKKVRAMMYGILYADLIMSLVNQIRPYELKKGESEELADYWVKILGKEMGAKGKISYKRVKENCRMLVEDFSKIPVEKREACRVGIVGEIFVKYSPLGNNDLERFLISEGAETVVPGLYDFCLAAVYNGIHEGDTMKNKTVAYPVLKWLYSYLCKKKREISSIISESGRFRGWTPFEETVSLCRGIISTSVKMGEGWLLTAEMLELAREGCSNIVCTQPFGCLPNHICGKGMMKPIKELNPDINIIAVDYDPGASRVNQENRLKLMLANAGRKQIYVDK